MDPRSPASPEELAKQFQLAHEIYGEAIEARRALNEMIFVQKQLLALEPKLASPALAVKAALADARLALDKILTNKSVTNQEHAGPAGMQDAYTGIASALRVVEKQ